MAERDELTLRATVRFSFYAKPAAQLFGRVQAMDSLGILGAQLRKRAAVRGWALYELADHAGLARTTVYRIVSGERSPTLEKMDRLAMALGCETWELLKPR